MTLTQLKYILAVDRCRNFAQAARECFVTQPTLSMQIQKLEEYLQVTIFDRSVNPVRTTAVGKRILALARDVMHKSDALEELARSTRQEIAGDFSLAIIPTLAPYLLPYFVENFRTAYPKVQLHLYEHQTDEIIALLREDKLDAALLATPLELKDIREEVLFYEGFQLLFSQGHELLKLKEVREDQLKLEEAWLLKEGHCLRAQVLQLCRPKMANVDRSVYFEGGSIETLVNLLNSMPGFTVVPDLAVAHLSADAKKRLRPVKGKRPVREVSLVSGPFALKTSITEALATTIRKALPAELLNLTKRDSVLEI